jgi:glycosyltransferase involved in cell wall biosynthesis
LGTESMKVVYSVGVTVPGGGIGNLAAQALKALVQDKSLYKAYLTGNKTDFLNTDQVATFPMLNKIPSYVLKDNLFDLWVATQFPKVDIFHGWNNYSLFSLRRAKKHGAKTVIERASSHILTQKRLLGVEMQKFGLNQVPVNPITLRKSIKEYEEADFVLVPSEFVFKSFLEQGYPERKLKLLEFGVESQKFQPVKRKEDGIFRAIFVGQVGIRKGIPYLLKAWEELDLKDSELLLVGPIYGDIKDLIKNYDLKKVRFVHYSNNLTEYYTQSDFFVFPSIEEGSALVTFEAMASGLPVVTTQNSGSIVEDGKEGFIVETASVESLKAKIQELYNNRDLLTNYSKAARKKVESYTWENYRRKLISLYHDIRG